MNISLNNAPFSQPLQLIKVNNHSLCVRFHHMGLYENDILTRLDEDISIQPVRVRGPRGDCIFGKGMATKIVAHLDDNRKLPVAEMKPGESGHIEGIVGGGRLSEALETLGINENDLITLVHRIPPMEYTALVDRTKRARLNEGITSKIWGTLDGRYLQFCSSRKDKVFHVEKIFGGRMAHESVEMHGGIRPGVDLILESVKPAETIIATNSVNPVIIRTNDGLRLLLNEKSCDDIIVSPV